MAETALQTQNQVNSLSIIDSVEIGTIQNTLSKINQFQMVIQNTLKQDHDYGIIPGTSKPTLLKPGAEKILMLMGLTSEYEVTERVQDYEKGFFAFTVRCELYKNGIKITEGVGHCNTKEKKYINQDPYTLANTCLKMAKKRAQIDATLTVASLSEVFTQDIEDMQDYIQTEQVETMTAAEAAQTKLTFGKYKGKTLKEIYKIQPDYLDWLYKQEKTQPAIKKAIELMFDALEQQKKQKEAKQQEQTKQAQPQDQQEQAPLFDEDGPPFDDINFEDVPFE